MDATLEMTNTHLKEVFSPQINSTDWILLAETLYMKYKYSALLILFSLHAK